MATAFVQSSKNDQVSNATSLSSTLSATSAGQTIIVAVGLEQAGSITSVVTTGGTGSDSFTLTSLNGAAGTIGIDYAIYLLQSCGAGRTGVTVNYAGATSFSDMFVWVISGQSGTVIDKSVTANASSNTAVTGNTATLTSADEFAIQYGITAAGFSAVLAPWTSDGIQTNTADAAGHQVLTATTPVSGAFTNTNGAEFFIVVATFKSAAAAFVVLGDYTLDNGLTGLDTVCDKIFVCSQMPTSYTDATVTSALGNKNWGAGAAFGSPAARTGGGRQITSNAITDGAITANGTVTSWAAVDTANSRLLASGNLSGGKAVTNGQVFTLGAFTLGIPRS